LGSSGFWSKRSVQRELRQYEPRTLKKESWKGNGTRRGILENEWDPLGDLGMGMELQCILEGQWDSRGSKPLVVSSAALTTLTFISRENYLSGTKQ